MLDPNEITALSLTPCSSRLKEAPMQHARPTRLGRAAAFAVLAMFLGVVALSLSQCTMVGDSLTGVDLSKGRPTTCIKQCNDFYAMQYDNEQKLYAQNKENCQQLSQPAKDNCLAAELARHQAKMAELGQAKIDCQNNCHHQGTGSSG